LYALSKNLQKNLSNDDVKTPVHESMRVSAARKSPIMKMERVKTKQRAAKKAKTGIENARENLNVKPNVFLMNDNVNTPNSKSSCE